MASLIKIPLRHQKTVTSDDIRLLIGPFDEDLVRAILQTGATPGEVLCAYEMLEEDHFTQPISDRHMPDRVRSVYNILDYGSADLDWRGWRQ
jgi:hypothetical protein